MARPRRAAPGGSGSNFLRNVNAMGNRIGDFAEEQWIHHRRRTCEVIGGALLFGAGVALGGAGCGGAENASSPPSSIDRCPNGYQGQRAGTAGAAIRRFGKAEATINTRINLLNSSNGNTDALKKILDTFGDTSVHDIGSFVCQTFTASNQPEMLLSPHAEEILGELSGVDVFVPPYTHAVAK